MIKRFEPVLIPNAIYNFYQVRDDGSYEQGLAQFIGIKYYDVNDVTLCWFDILHSNRVKGKRASCAIELTELNDFLGSK